MFGLEYEFTCKKFVVNDKKNSIYFSANFFWIHA